MGFIDIDPELQKSDAIANFFSGLIVDQRNIMPKLGLPQILLGKTRSGLDSGALTSSIIGRMKETGIPTGPLADGTPNAIEELVRIMVEEIVDAIQNDMRVDVAVDIGMLVTSTGANAGGPVASTGANIKPHTGVGIAR